MARRATVAASAVLLCGVRGQGPETSVIRPGVAWTDTSGNRVYAGGANLLLDGGRYWLIGEGKKVCVRSPRASAPANPTRFARGGRRRGRAALLVARSLVRAGYHTLRAPVDLTLPTSLSGSAQPPHSRVRGCSYQDISECFNLYSSTDLVTWTVSFTRHVGALVVSFPCGSSLR